VQKTRQERIRFWLIRTEVLINHRPDRDGWNGAADIL
jgi:hypothetical protein